MDKFILLNFNPYLVILRSFKFFKKLNAKWIQIFVVLCIQIFSNQ
jgi:hypothetical protein